MKVLFVMLMATSIGLCASENNTFSLEQLFPTSATTFVLDICMQVCSDLVFLDSCKEKPSLFWMDALLGKMVRLQGGVERLTGSQERSTLYADDLVYLLAMIHRVDIAAESLQVDREYQDLYRTLLHTIKSRLAHLLTQAYTDQRSI